MAARIRPPSPFLPFSACPYTLGGRAVFFVQSCNRALDCEYPKATTWQQLDARRGAGMHSPCNRCFPHAIPLQSPCCHWHPAAVTCLHVVVIPVPNGVFYKSKVPCELFAMEGVPSKQERFIAAMADAERDHVMHEIIHEIILPLPRITETTRSRTAVDAAHVMSFVPRLNQNQKKEPQLECSARGPIRGLALLEFGVPAAQCAMLGGVFKAWNGCNH